MACASSSPSGAFRPSSCGCATPSLFWRRAMTSAALLPEPTTPATDDPSPRSPESEYRRWLRPQTEMDALVREAGFEKEGMLVDEWGIFTVSWARRGGTP
ncbi:MAG: class I SAM-dependent methyltransferase family protein [Planctomycetes bacterium]|nr:class I SAM-dependent methyltransferase family protein [Planctomycetota bacterium]